MRRKLLAVMLACGLVLSGCSFGKSSEEPLIDSKLANLEEAFGLDYNNVKAIKGVTYDIKTNSVDFEWKLVEKSDSGIEYSTDVNVEKTDQGLAVTGIEPGVAVIRLSRGEQTLDEITFYTIEMGKLPKEQEKIVKDITDGEIEAVAVDDGITSDYVDLIQKKLVLSSLDSVQSYARVGDKSYWIEIKDLKSRIYYAFYNALENLKNSDFSLYYPVTRIKYDAVIKCEDHLFEMLPHLKGAGISGSGSSYSFKIKYKSLDNKELPDLVLEHSV